MKKIVVVAGPTAAGKTRLGIELALGLGGEIVSADSMQVYRRMDIGTAKASAEERALVPHHMLDVAEPFEDYSAARYVEQAAACCEDILARGRLPIVVGGTGLYIDSPLSGRDFAPGRRGRRSFAGSSPTAMRRRAAPPCWRSFAPLTRSGRKSSTPGISAALSGPWRYTPSPA